MKNTSQAELVQTANQRLGARSHAAFKEILERIGYAGEQVQADEQRYFAFDGRTEQYKSNAHWGIDLDDLSLVATRADGSAAIATFIHAGWADGEGWSENSALSHMRFAVFLIVRDTSSGERHIMRIPPRFGMTRTTTWKDYNLIGDWRGTKPCKERDLSRADDLIHAAIAWTFSVEPSEYQPDAQA